MTAERYLELKAAVLERGYGGELAWAANIPTISNSLDFFYEYAYVVCNSGMKQQIARVIYDKIKTALHSGGRVADVFGHKAKAAAIEYVWKNQSRLYCEYKLKQSTYARLEYLRSLPWIGKITCYHLAKNYGEDVAKPDRHLERIAGAEGTEGLCARLSAETGDKVTLVDTIIWRAANQGLV